MTRFARASGSKGSNEKRPEDATPWQDMKSALIKKPGKKKVSENDVQEQQPEDATSWQDMKTAMTSKKKKNEQDEEDVDVPSTSEIQNVWAQLVNESEKKSEKKKKKSTDEPKPAKKKRVTEDSNDPPKPAKKKRVTEDSNDPPKPAKKKRVAEDSNDQPKPVKKKRLAEDDPEIRVKKKVKQSEVPKTEEKKIVLLEKDTEKKKRRKEALKPAELIINGKPVKVAPFDGFIVQADDAARLRELRKSMKSKGIPDIEIERAIKLERRRAEKALARLRKKVCFHCRSTGHNLSECPLIESDQRATGICYKCGSTEHTHFQCKVTRGDDFKFAECFICKEQGHIAKQCPDNPRGLYPKGGGCATCGDVTHLKKDCPKYLAEKEDDVTVNTRNDRSLEALDEDLPVKKSTPFRGKKLNKRVKF